MPSVEVHYKDAGALRFLKLLSGYFGFKVVEKSAPLMNLTLQRMNLVIILIMRSSPEMTTENMKLFLLPKASMLRRCAVTYGREDNFMRY